jgi:transposase
VRGVPRVDDRRVLNGIFWRLRTGALWADIPARHGPHTTCVNRAGRMRRRSTGPVKASSLPEPCSSTSSRRVA